MNRADRVLMARLSRVNQAIAEAVVLGLPRPNEPLSPTWLREVAAQMEAVAADMRARADEIDRVVEQSPDPPALPSIRPRWPL